MNHWLQPTVGLKKKKKTTSAMQAYSTFILHKQ